MSVKKQSTTNGTEATETTHMDGEDHACETSPYISLACKSTLAYVTTWKCLLPVKIIHGYDC
jgi:hypothetical protein